MTADNYARLSESLQQRTLALFLGADLPRDVTGLPSRADLARDMARRYRLDESLSLAEVAQRVSQAGNRFEFTDFMRNALDTAGRSPSAFQQGVVALVKEHSIITIITTAYDNLLEVTFQQAGVGLNRIVRGSDVSFIKPDRPTLIKLYGDAQQPESLIVTDRDHSQLLRDRDKEDVLDEVRRAFKRNIILFYGYNLSDPDFKFLFDQIAESKFARLAYAVWPGRPEADVRMWRDRGIVILDEDPLGVTSGQAAMPPASATQPKVKVTTASAASGNDSPKSLASSIPSNVSGGVNLASEKTDIDGDVVGRDKIEHKNVTINISGGTVVFHGDKASVDSSSSRESAASNPEPYWNFVAMRELLTAAFSNEELITLCFDHFRGVYETFSSDMSKNQKIQILLDHCERNLEVERLLEIVQAQNPHQYARFESRLH